MDSPSLPFEIYLYIIGQVTCDTTLCSLSLCCRAFRDDAQRTLLYHPRVLLSYPPARQKQFINAMASSPNRLAPMVHIYALDYFPAASRKLINAALRAMSNLKQLGVLSTIQIDAGEVAHWKFNLDVLSWGEYRDIFLSNPDILSAILQNQPNLKHLRAFGDTISGRVQMDPRWCPNLQGIAGSANFVNPVLSDARPIHHVHWINFSEDQFMEPGVDGMTLSRPPNALSAVRYFSFQLHIDVPDLVFLRHMDSLILIDIYVHCASDREMADRLDFLANVPRLQRLILTGSVRLHCPDARAEPYMISAHRAFSLCTNLRYIDIRYDPSERTFYRFFPPSTTSGHGGMEVTTVGEDEVYTWRVMHFSLVNPEPLLLEERSSIFQYHP
ncbi:hypothetical protein D9619_007580 [Psilocybe cf. subviscida]|uniref:F-box domain-containing protein n=1 Tax=Psilocybe cf. subviscida TaxID=2480587 RepID=A0A8H5B1P5_9AGAR|nr:hypothetical protein D9619_007580 [Psilocybe cf. subviscida]